MAEEKKCDCAWCVARPSIKMIDENGNVSLGASEVGSLQEALETFLQAGILLEHFSSIEQFKMVVEFNTPMGRQALEGPFREMLAWATLISCRTKDEFLVQLAREASPFEISASLN